MKGEEMKIICSMCKAEGRIIHGELSYRWSEVHRKTVDVNDSALVHYESDFYICPKCLCIILGIEKQCFYDSCISTIGE